MSRPLPALAQGRGRVGHDARAGNADRPAGRAPAATLPSLSCACGGGCPRCARARLAASGDASERSAEARAQRALSGPATHRAPLLPEAAAPRTPALGADGGRALPSDLRIDLESRFAAGLAHVRIHDDPQAARRARLIQARAYTQGTDIHFAEGAFAPASAAGRRLLAHEVAHVLQAHPADTIHRDSYGDVTQTSIHPSFAEDLSDQMLIDLMAYLENLAADQVSSDDTYDVIENNLQVLRAVYLDRQAAQPVKSEERAPMPKAAPVAAETIPTEAWEMGPRGEHMPQPGYFGPLRPIAQYTRPRAVDLARQGCYEAAELAEKYMCPTCHVLTKIEPCDFSLRGYVRSYEDGYKTGSILLGSALFAAALPEVAATLGAYEAGTATTEAVTGEASGIRVGNLLSGTFDPGRELSTTERIFSGVEAGLFWTGMGWELSSSLRAGRQATMTPAFKESAGARGRMGANPRITPEVTQAEQMGFLQPGGHQGVSATAKTSRSQTTSIRADLGETAAYRGRLGRGEFGIESPQGANRAGPDYITASRESGGELWINVGDAKSRVSASSAFGTTKQQLPQTWQDAVSDAVASGRLDLGDPGLEAEIRQAWQQGRVRIRQDNVDYSSSGQGAVTFDTN